MSKFFITLIAAMMFSFSANAGLLIEPHIDYNIAGGQADWSGTKMEYSGLQYGARLGAQYLGLMGGLAYTHSTYDLKATIITTLTEYKASQKQDDVGIFVGFNAPILLRVWLAYYFSSKMTQTADNAIHNNGDYMKGNTTEIGVGFTPLPLLSLNVMYRMSAYDKAHNAVTGVDTTKNPKYEPKEIVLGVSLPFHLL